MDLRRQLIILRAWLWLLVASVLLAASSAFLVSGAMPKIYEAENTLIVGQSLTASNPNSDQLLAAQRLSQTYATVVTTRPLAQLAPRRRRAAGRQLRLPRERGHAQDLRGRRS